MNAENSRHRFYWLLLVVQSAGAAPMISVGAPFYLQILTRTEHQRSLSLLILAYACVIASQVAYWAGYGRFPARGLGGQVFLGHMLIFASRLCFVLVSSTFCVAYIVRAGDLNVRPSGLALLTFTLFALFCYARELERIGAALLLPRRG